MEFITHEYEGTEVKYLQIKSTVVNKALKSLCPGDLIVILIKQDLRVDPNEGVNGM